MDIYTHRLARSQWLASLVGSLLALLLLSTGAPAHASSSNDWLQFGGPNRDFSSPAIDLAEDWPENGPKLLWRRSLGDHGHARFWPEGDKIYGFFRRGEQDVLLSLNGETGETPLEAAYDSHSPRDTTPNLARASLDSSHRRKADLYRELHHGAQSWNKSTATCSGAKTSKEELQAKPPGRGFGSQPSALQRPFDLARGW